MEKIILGALTLCGVALGAYLQHIFAKSKEKSERIDSYRHKAYADYLQGIAELARDRTKDRKESISLVADAKCRIVIYGDDEVLKRLAQFERAGTNLAYQPAIEAFLFLVKAMRNDSSSENEIINKDDIKIILFGKDEN